MSTVKRLMRRIVARLRAGLFDLMHPHVDIERDDGDWCIRCDLPVYYRGEFCRRCGREWGHE